MRRIILASSSPRRKEILGKTGLPFEVQESTYEEDMSLDMPHEKLAEYLSAQKARSVARLNKDSVIIGADTFIIFGDMRLGKPKTPERAKEMLSTLNGKEHKIVSGVTIIDTHTDISISFHDTTGIFMKKSTPETIEAYVKTGEPLDKAGAYALQGLGALLIERIEGDFFNAMGLPLAHLAEELKAFGINIL